MTEITSDWLQVLTQFGARFELPAEPRPGPSTGSPLPEVTGFDHAQDPDSATDFIAPLTDLGLIAATGEDAAGFLHNQLTNDVEHLGTQEARLAGYCSPKGRLLATMTIWKTADTIYLQLPREIQPAVQKRLQMFILRSKAKLADATQAHAILGISGHAAAQALLPWFPVLPAAPFAKVDTDAGMLIRMPDAEGRPRYQWIASVDAARDACPTLVKTLVPAPTRRWRLDEIRAALPRITQATQEQFVPQMVNFEAVGGVNFRKGCYPGQEIVARSQYLGKLKRRMMPASVQDAQARAGMEVFSSADPDQPCGMVVNAEPVSGHSECLVELKTASLDGGSIHLGSASGPALAFKPLPYPLPDAV